MALQTEALHEALRRRISTLPRYLESDPSFEFEQRPDWCDALHATDVIGDQELEGFISRALLYANVAFRSLTGELDRRVRAWIMANSTMGAGALHRWSARDEHAPRLPRQALDSKGHRLLTPRERCSNFGSQSGKRAGNSIGMALPSSNQQSVNCVTKSEQV